MQKIYVDHAATTPVHPEACEAMMDVLKNNFGNPSSIHQHGRKARKQLDEAREKLAASIGARPDEIILTSSGTEADNLAIVGYVTANKQKGNHIITTKIEHHAVLHTCERLEKEGFSVTYLPVDEQGRVDVKEVEASITDQTTLITIMHGNNEVGSIQPVTAIADIAENYGIAFHTDAVQSYGLVDINVKTTSITMLTASSHKINGPKGAAFLYVENGTTLAPSLTGGEQERKRRAGTENLPAVAGFAAAARLAQTDSQEHYRFYQALCEHFITSLTTNQVTFEENGPTQDKLPHITNIYMPGIEVESFLVQLDMAGISASSGSACTAGSVEPSHVLDAMFHDQKRASSSVRFSFGMDNTFEEVEYMAKEIKKITNRSIEEEMI
ncbi:cysteine desulfurase [Salibacterium salarium]|uniref:Cysteine desulfurase n=1 Tax=Salibacterium salarium TaxID=284579 RepID=A0A3R9PIQ1_9BACI|nr:cysteine desulfurase family protein [Salibacterium salarium]RSL31592.1 cysteine desulfurase [Salibacterium salarium]